MQMLEFPKGKLFELAKNIAEEYYDEKTLAHARRVAMIVCTTNAYHISTISKTKDNVELLQSIALLHDILEDTNFDPKLFIEENKCDCIFVRYMFSIVRTLTKDKETRYNDYIKDISENIDSPGGTVAYIVKVADMLDHLAQKETLTDRLKDKYISALPFLL